MLYRLLPLFCLFVSSYLGNQGNLAHAADRPQPQQARSDKEEKMEVDSENRSSAHTGKRRRNDNNQQRAYPVQEQIAEASSSAAAAAAAAAASSSANASGSSDASSSSDQRPLKRNKLPQSILERIPNDMLRIVAANLDFNSKLMLSCLNHSFQEKKFSTILHHLEISPKTLSKFGITEVEINSNPAALAHFLSSTCLEKKDDGTFEVNPKVTYLKFSAGFRISNEDLFFIRSYFPNLRTLILNDVIFKIRKSQNGNVSQNLFANLVGLGKLEHLEVSSNPDDHLDLSGLINIPLKVFVLRTSNIIEMLPELKNVPCKDLSLSLSKPNITPAIIQQLQSLPSLSSLDLGITGSSYNHLEALGNLQLKRLYLRTDKVILSGLAHLKRLPLEHLSISSHFEITDEELSQFFRSLPYLKSYNIEVTPRVRSSEKAAPLRAAD